MTALEDVALIDFEDKYARQAVAMWRASKEAALGVKEIHSFHEHLTFLRTKLVNDHAVILAIHQPSDSVVGIMALNGTELNQLYIHVDYQGIGIGTQLLKMAKRLSPGTLRLYTFEINTIAQKFYEKHGFKIIGRGCDNEEQLPDLRYEWTEASSA